MMPDTDDLPFELHRKDDGVVLVWKGEGPATRLVLGPFDRVGEKMANFLAAQDFGEI